MALLRALLLLLLAAAPAQAGPVVLISVDGMLPAYYLEADKLGLQIPNIRALCREGVRAQGATSVMPSVTFPSHTTMITGVNPSKHGILNNSIFDPDGALGGGWYFYYDDVKAPTLFSAARAAGLRAAAVTWPVTAGAPLELNLPDMYPVPTVREAKNLIALTRTGSKPDLLADLLVPKALIDMRDDLRGKVAVRFLGERPDFLAVHLLELDEAQHKFGPRSPEALATLERLDGILGNIFDGLRALGRWDETTVVLLSDHGFFAVHHQIHLTALLRTLGLVQLDGQGNLVSWKAMVAPSSGTAALVMHPKATAEDRRKVDDAVRLLLGNPAYGVGRAYRGAELAATGGFAGAYVVLEALPGHIFVKGGEAQPLVAPTSNFNGAHGYDPRRPEMRASFIIRGPKIRRGKEIGLVRLLDVAPTVARVLGIDLKGEGRVLTEVFEGVSLESVRKEPYRR
ncbi:MAG TPA: alkaline phosphatase family protein [Polyangia bacterium]|nr:alkaline phosphatase family protein [Polyangia bacterium]